MVLHELSSVWSCVCEMTKDQTDPRSPAGRLRSLTIEPLWYELTLDTGTIFFISFFCSWQIRVSLDAVFLSMKRFIRAVMNVSGSG